MEKKRKISWSLKKLFHESTGYIRTYPNFFITGSSYCGKTLLYNYLIQHPQILENLREETGYEAITMSKLFKYNPSVGHSTETVHCFIVNNVKKIPNFKINEKEINSVIKVNHKKLLKMIKDKKITDSKTICAILYYSMFK